MSIAFEGIYAFFSPERRHGSQRFSSELVIYELASDLSGELGTFGPFTMEGVPGTAEDISVFGDVAAMMFVDFSNRGPASTDGHKIVILNWKTGASVQIDPDLPLVSRLLPCNLMYSSHRCLGFQPSRYTALSGELYTLLAARRNGIS
jgi:hypothetical protein